MEVHIEELAHKELSGMGKIQSFNQQITDLMDAGDQDFIDRIKYKASTDFLHELDGFINYMDAEYFSPEDITIDSVYISKEDLVRNYHTYERMPIQQRLEKVASIAGSRDRKGRKVTPAASRKIKSAIMNQCLSIKMYFHCTKIFIITLENHTSSNINPEK